MKNYILTALLVFSIMGVYSETYSFARLDNTQGLSNNEVRSIFKDSRGFMWFGTKSGLNRFDGYQFKIYKTIKNDSTSLPFNEIGKIQEDVNGNLWIKLASNYTIYNYTVYNIHTEKFTHNLSAILSPLGIHFTPRLVEIDNEKNYYFTRSNDGIYKYDVKLKKIFHYKQAPKSNMLSLGDINSIKVEKGFFWVLYYSGLLERFNEKSNMVDFRSTYIMDHSKGSFLYKNLFVDSEGCPWVYPAMGDKGVLFYDFRKSDWVYFGNEKSKTRHASYFWIGSDYVRDIAQDRSGKIWIASDHGGICLYDKNTNATKELRNDPLDMNSISQDSPISLFHDNTDIMWIGTYKNGVSYYHSSMFKFEKTPLFYFHHPDLGNKDCNNFLVDRDDNLWIGTNSYGLLKWEKRTGKFTLFHHLKNNPSSLSSDIITSILQDKKGTMWIATFLGGINQMVGNRFIRYLPNANDNNSITSISVFGLIEDKQQNLWIATLGSGVDKLDSSRKMFRNINQKKNKQMSSNYYLSMYSKDSTYIYLSSATGIDILNTTNNKITPVFKNKNQIKSLSDININNCLIDKKNQLWLATENGITIYNPIKKTFTYINKANGLTNEQVVSLVEDNDGNIWAGTRNGLACINRSANSKASEKQQNIIFFDENDGLPSSIFNPNAVYKDKTGKIYFGCTKGYTAFNPKSIIFNKTIPQPRFTELLIGKDIIQPGIANKARVILDESINQASRIELQYDERNFTVYFSALNYIQPEKNRYRYKLKGFDKEWTETKNSIGTASYTNLNQGTYQLIVYASNNDNVWNTKPAILEIVIKPPFWFTWWAIIVYILLVVALIRYTFNFKMQKQKREFEIAQQVREAKQLQEVTEMKFRFFTNIGHEFRTPIALIIGPIERLITESKNEDEKSLLTIIHRNANGLLDLVNQLLDFRKLDVQKETLIISVGDVVTFIRDICYSFNEFAARNSIKFTFSTSIPELQIEFDPDKMKKIVTNLLSNAFKFTPSGGSIEVKMSLIQRFDDGEKQLKICVSDTGIGISSKDLNHIFERFYRVENAENSNQTGTGIGLHIASEYAKLHKGTITVESQQGQGSMFTLTIPTNLLFQEEIISQNNVNVESWEETISDEQLPIEEEDVENECKHKMPLMLIIDDNEDFRDFISRIFTNKYRILKAENGEVALKIILDEMPDLIISDVMMPKMNGLELCQTVKQDIRISHIPIILLTAKTGDENKYRGLETGAEEYISKPFNVEMLSLKVERIIDRQRKIHERFKQKVEIATSEIKITSMDEKFITKAVSLVENSIGKGEFLVEDLCREMGMSRVYLYKKILSLTDKTPSEFIRFIRLKRASQLLEKSQLYINEVAYQAGFKDLKHFRKYFKEEFGVSPNEYKKKFTN